jgi:hypothetical protein
VVRDGRTEHSKRFWTVAGYLNICPGMEGFLW